MQSIINQISTADWFSLASALVGAIVGGLISAVVSYWTARQSSEAARQLEMDARRDLQKLAAFRLMSKLMTIVGDVDFLIQHVRGSLSSSELANEEIELWTIIVPIVGAEHNELSFEPDELALFFEMKDYKYIEKLIRLGEDYNDIKNGFKAYSERREEMTTQLSALERGVAKLSGSSITSDLLPAELKRFQPTMMALNKLIDDLYRRAEQLMKEITEVIDQFGPKMKTYFRDESFPSLQRVDPSPGMSGDPRDARRV